MPECAKSVILYFTIRITFLGPKFIIINAGVFYQCFVTEKIFYGIDSVLRKRQTVLLISELMIQVNWKNSLNNAFLSVETEDLLTNVSGK